MEYKGSVRLGLCSFGLRCSCSIPCVVLRYEKFVAQPSDAHISSFGSVRLGTIPYASGGGSTDPRTGAQILSLGEEYARGAKGTLESSQEHADQVVDASLHCGSFPGRHRGLLCQRPHTTEDRATAGAVLSPNTPTVRLRDINARGGSMAIPWVR